MIARSREAEETIGDLLGSLETWLVEEAHVLFAMRDRRLAALTHAEAAEVGFVLVLLGELARRDRKTAVVKRLRAIVCAIRTQTKNGWRIEWPLIERRARDRAAEYAFVRDIVTRARRLELPLRELANMINTNSLPGRFRLTEQRRERR